MWKQGPGFLKGLSMKPNRISLKDVARSAGVSIATASVVINGKIGQGVRVSRETQDRIWAEAKKLGYVGNPAARSLAGGSNNIAGIFSYESIFPPEQYDFYYPFLSGIEQEAEVQGYDLLLITHRGYSKEQRQQRINRLQMADGAILLGLEKDEKEVASLIQSGYKIVTIGKREFPNADASYISFDYSEATKKLTRHAIEMGHRNLCYIRLKEDTIPTLEREIGFRLATAKYKDLNCQIVFSEEKSIDPGLVRKQVKSGVTCFIVERFLTADVVLKELHKMRLSVPGDISLAVLGGPGQSVVSPLDWATIEVPGIEAGKAALRILVELLKSNSQIPARQMLPCTIHTGNTISNINK